MNKCEYAFLVFRQRVDRAQQEGARVAPVSGAPGTQVERLGVLFHLGRVGETQLR